MPAIHFDITGDNSNMVSVIQDTTERVRRMAETVDNLRGAEPFDNITEASKALNEAIKDNEKYIEELRDKLSDLSRQQAEAAAKGDMAGVSRISAEMETAAQAIQTTSENTEKYREALAALGQEAGNTEGVMVKLLGGQEKFDAIMRGLPGPLKSVVAGLNGMVGAARAFIATPLGAVLTALILAYKAVSTWLHKSAEGQQALAKISGYVSGVLAGLQQIVMDVGKALYKAFSDPKQAISELWQSLKDNLIGRLKAAGGVFVNFGKIIGNAFKGDFKEAGEAAKDMANDWQKVFTGKDVSELKEGARAVTDRIKGIHEIGKAQSDLSARENKLHRDRTVWMNEEAELDKQIAEERNKLRMGSQSERAAASARMQELINKKTERNMELAREEYEIKKASNALTDTSQEDLDEEERLRARITQIETQGVAQKGFALRIQDSMNRQLGVTSEKMSELINKENELLESLTEKQGQQGLETAALGISAMREGFDREMAESDHEHEQRMAAIEKEHKERLKKIEEFQKAEYKARYGTTRGFVFNQDTEAVAAAMEIFGTDVANEEERRRQALSQVFKRYTDEYKDFITQWGELTDKFNNDRKALTMSGAVLDNPRLWDELNEREREAFEGLAKSWAESGRNAELTKWFQEIGQQSLMELEIMLSDLELDMELLGENVPEEEVAKLRAQIVLLKKAIKDGDYADEMEKMAKNAANASVSWTDLNKVLTETAALFKESGDAIGGMFGEALKMAGSFATSVAKAGNAMQAFQAANKAKDVAGMVTSGITAAGAAVAVASEIAGKIKEARERTEEVDRATQAYYRTLRQIDESKALEALSNAFGTDSYGQFVKNMQFAREAGAAIGSISDSLSADTVSVRNWGKALMSAFTGPIGWLLGAGTGAYNGTTVAGDLVSDMRTGWQKFWGNSKNIVTASMSDFFDSNGNLMGEKLKEWYSTYGEGLSDANRQVVESMLGEFDKLSEATAGIRSYLSDVFGGVASDVANDMVSQFIETGDVIQDMSKYMEDFGVSVAKSIVQAKLMGEIFTEDNQNVIADMIAAGKTSEAVETFNGLLDKAREMAPGIQEFLSGLGLDSLGSSNAEASSRSFASMSQETASVLEGRFASVQMSNEMIAQGVTAISATLFTMQSLVTAGGAAISDIRDMHILEAAYLADIAKQTKPIPGMVATLDKIQLNTSRL